MNEYTAVNPLKMEKFLAIRTKCEELRTMSPLTITVTAKPPVTGEANAYVTLTLPLPTVLAQAKARLLLSRLFADADSVLIAKAETGAAFSFCVDEVWL